MPKIIWMKDTEDEQLKLCKFNEVICHNDCEPSCFYKFVANIIELINQNTSTFIVNYIFADNFWEVLVNDEKLNDVFDKSILKSVDKLTFEECHKYICDIGLINLVKIIDEYYIYNQKDKITLKKLQNMNNVKDIQMFLCLYVHKCIKYCDHIEDISDESDKSDKSDKYVEPINEIIVPVTAVPAKLKNADSQLDAVNKCDADVDTFINKIKNNTSSQVYYKILLKNNSNNIAKCIYEKIKNIRNTNKDWLIRSTHGYIFNHLKLPLYEKEDLENIIYEYGIQKAIQNFVINKRHYENIINIVESDMSKIYLGMAYYIICESFEFMSFVGNY